MLDALQIELINALNTVGPHTRNEARLKRVTDAIKNVDIPPDDYEKVLKFIFAVLVQQPEIMDAKPHDKPLKDLCLSCINHVATINELKATHKHR